MIDFGKVSNLSDLPAFDGKFHHVGVAVESIERSVPLYFALGFRPETSVIRDIKIGVDVQFFSQGALRIELVQPLTQESPTTVWLRGGSPLYHIGFEVTSLDLSIVLLKKHGFRRVFGPIEAAAFQQREVCFMINAKRLLIELIDKD